MHATFCLRLPSIQLGLLHIAEKAGLECRLRTQYLYIYMYVMYGLDVLYYRFNIYVRI